jgi:hypothetical protein
VRQSIESLGGQVKYITALDYEHHIFLGEWHSAFPDAKVLGVDGLPAKRTAQKNEDVPFFLEFTAENAAEAEIDPEFDTDFEHEYIGSHPNKELVFFYKPDRTLIEADLMFNLPATEQYSRSGISPTQGFLTKLFSGIQGTAGSALWQKRIIWYLASKQDRPAFNRSIQNIDRWNFDRIIPCHGDVIESEGKGIFRKVFEWHLQGQAQN